MASTIRMTMLAGGFNASITEMIMMMEVTRTKTAIMVAIMICRWSLEVPVCLSVTPSSVHPKLMCRFPPLESLLSFQPEYPWSAQSQSILRCRRIALVQQLPTICI